MPEVTPELPRYRCHKEVNALKVAHFIEEDGADEVIMVFADDVFLPKLIPSELFQKHEPEDGWYYVEYSSKYASFSPPEAFEDGYSLIDGEAVIDRLKAERGDLKDNINKLRVFGASASFELLDGYHKTLMRDQLHFMNKYADILSARIADLQEMGE